MKQTIFLIFIFATFYHSSYAQTAAGNKFIGGAFEIGFIGSEEADNNNFNFSLQPQFGYFIKDNFAIGSGIGFSVASSSNKKREFKSSNTTFFISPFARYYFPLIGDKFYIFGQGQLEFNFYNNNSKLDGEEISNSKGTSIALAVGPGFAFFPTENWAFDLSFEGISFELDNPEGEDNNNSSFGLVLNSFTPSVGINYFF